MVSEKETPDPRLYENVGNTLSEVGLKQYDEKIRKYARCESRRSLSTQISLAILGTSGLILMLMVLHHFLSSLGT